MMSSIRYNNNSRLCKKYHLTNYNTDVGIDYCFMAPQGNTELYSILSKVVGLVPSSNVNSALSYYIAENAKPSFLDMIAEHGGGSRCGNCYSVPVYAEQKSGKES